MSSEGSELVLSMTDRAQGGDAFAWLNGKKIFVPGALLGEEVAVSYGTEHPTYIEGKLVRIVRSSPDRVPSFCNSSCGSCSYLCLRYEAEISDKRKRLCELYADTPYTTLVGGAMFHAMKEPFYYRNKAVYACKMHNGKLIAGLYARDTHDIIPVEGCALEAKWISHVKNEILDFINKEALDLASDLRYIFLRGEDNGEHMCVLVMYKTQSTEHLKAISRLAACLNLASFKININSATGNRILGEEFILVSGKETIDTTLLGNIFRINAPSFLQINSVQTEVLYSRALELLNPSKDEVLADLYSGAGTISLFAAKHVSKVIGIECVESAVEDAKCNSKLNGITNAEFYCGLVEKVFPEVKKRGQKIDCAILDPSRRGADPIVFKTLADFNVGRFVYISCNPVTQKRDIKVAREYGYELRAFEAVDMFPHTEHVETVALLIRSDISKVD